MKIKIKNASCGYDAQPLKGKFGFKGNFLTSIWQVAVKLETENHHSIGVSVESALWSDAELFKRVGEEQGNKFMFMLTQYAASQSIGVEFETPFELIDVIFPKVYEYAKEITGYKEIKTTFILNALVPFDFAAWQLWARENGKEDFDEISKFEGKHQEVLANIPLISYHTPMSEVMDMVNNGTCLLKIKIGSDPDGDNNLDKMLEWDKNRILQIHQAVKDIKTPYTETGRVIYYLDANGRYDSKERLKKLLDFADKEGILENIVLLEEPFDEDNKIFVGDLPVCVAADESAHSLEDVKERYELGYKAVALKPIAKTLSVTIRMAEFAHKKGMMCFCADLTVVPAVVLWNMCVASRLNCISKMKIGVLESNGKQNYANWDKLMECSPGAGFDFAECKNGVFNLGESFYKHSGAVFNTSEYYEKLAVSGE